MSAHDMSYFSRFIGRTGLLKASNFLVRFNAPAVMPQDKTFPETVTMLAKAATTPGLTLLTNEERPWGQGSAFKMPYDAAHGDISVTFYLDPKYRTYDFFLAWIKNIVPMLPDLRSSMGGLYDNEVRYRADYIADINLYHYSENAQVANFKLMQAFPVSITEMNLDWSNGTELSTFTVTFAYRAFKLELMREYSRASRFATEEVPTSSGDLQRFGQEIPAGTIRDAFATATSFRQEDGFASNNSLPDVPLSDENNPIYAEANQQGAARKLQSASLSSAWNSLAQTITSGLALAEMGRVIRGVAQNARSLNDFVGGYSSLFSASLSDPTKLAALNFAFGSDFLGDFRFNFDRFRNNTQGVNLGVFGG